MPQSYKTSHILFRSGLKRHKIMQLNQSKYKNMDKYNDLINNTMQKHYYHNEEDKPIEEDKKRQLKPTSSSSSLTNKTGQLISDSIQKYFDKKDGKENDKDDKSDNSIENTSDNDNLKKKSIENIHKTKSDQLNFLNGKTDQLIKNSFQAYIIEKRNNKRKKKEDSSDDDEINSDLPIRRRVRTYREIQQERKKSSKYRRDIEREKEEEKFKCELYNIPYDETEDSSFVVYDKSELIDSELMSSDREDTSAFLINNPSFIDDECEEGEETGSIKGDFSDSEEEKMYRDAKGDKQDSFYENDQHTEDEDDSIISEEEFSRRIKRKMNQFVFDEVEVDGEDLHTDDIDRTENEIIDDSFIVDDNKELTIDETNSDLNNESSVTNIYSSPAFSRKKRRVAKLNDTEEENLTIINLNNSKLNCETKSPDKNTILLDDTVLDNNEIKTINLSDTHLNQNLSTIDEKPNIIDLLSDDSLNQHSQTKPEFNNSLISNDDDKRNNLSNLPEFSDDEENNNWTKIGKKSKLQRIESDDESNKEEIWLSAKKKSSKNTSIESNSNEYKGRLRKRTSRPLFLETDDDESMDEEIIITKHKSKKSIKIESDDESISGNEKISPTKFKSPTIESDESTIDNKKSLSTRSKFKKPLKIESDDESMSGKKISSTKFKSPTIESDESTIIDNKETVATRNKSKKSPTTESDNESITNNKQSVSTRSKSKRTLKIESDDESITSNKQSLSTRSSLKRSPRIQSDNESIIDNKETVATRSKSKRSPRIVSDNESIINNKQSISTGSKSKKRQIIESDDDNSFVSVKKKQTRLQIIESDNNEETEKEITINKLDLLNSSSRNDESVECIFSETTHENIACNSFDLDTSNDLEDSDATLS